MKNMESVTHAQARVEIDSSVRAPDYWHLNLDEDWEVRLWTREFRCTEEVLRRAIAEVGPSAGAVRAYLAQSR
jgi:hypothetical protein